MMRLKAEKGANEERGVAASAAVVEWLPEAPGVDRLADRRGVDKGPKEPEEPLEPLALVGKREAGTR